MDRIRRRASGEVGEHYLVVVVPPGVAPGESFSVFARDGGLSPRRCSRSHTPLNNLYIENLRKYRGWCIY